MKIVHVCDYYNPEVGGILNLCIEKLADRGHEIVLYTSNISSYKNPGKHKREDITVKRYPGVAIGNFVVFPSMIKDFIKEDADIIQSYVAGFFATTICGYLRLVKPTPLVVRADFNYLERVSPIKHIYNFFWTQLPLKFADAMFVNMDIMKYAIQKRYHVDEKKVKVIPDGVDFKKINKARKKRLFGNKFVILNVGRVSRVKNLELIIRSLVHLKRNKKDFVFVMIGPCEDEDYFNTLIDIARKIGVIEHIKFLGKIPYEKIATYYKSSDVYVQSSSLESFCSSTLEAMAAGLPVIATKTGAIGYELFKKYDYWVKTPKELGEKLLELYDDSQKRKSVGKMLKKIAKQYDWEIIVDKVESLYRCMIQGD